MRELACGRCGTRFGCGVDAASCWCSRVPVEPARLAALSGAGDDCLCPACLALATDVAARGIATVARHPAVTRVELAGSRSRGTHEALSDWDFAVETSDFERLARDLPALVAPLEPLGEQWEPLGHFPVYQVLLPGPTKLEYLFLDHHQDARPPVTPSAETLGAIDTHFWDWTWWIATKASVGRDDLVAEHMAQLHRHLLRPMGVAAVPGDLDAAIRAYVARRGELGRAFGVQVPRALEEEVRDAVRRLGLHPGG